MKSMIRWFIDLSIRGKLLIVNLLFTLGFLVFAGYTYVSLSVVKVTGPIYQDIISSKDLWADAKGPSMNLMEAYFQSLRAYQLTDPEKIIEVKNQISADRSEYYARVDYWKKHITDAEIKSILVNELTTGANRFYDVLDNEYFPALSSGNREHAATILATKLDPIYKNYGNASDTLESKMKLDFIKGEQEAIELIDNRTFVFIILVIGINLVGFSFMEFINRGIVRLINMIKDKIKELADEGGDLTQTIHIDSACEIGELADNFNLLMESLRLEMKEIKESTNVLNDSVNDLASSSKEVSSTSNQQAAGVKEIVSTMEDSDAMSKTIQQKVSDVAHLTDSTRENVKQGFTVIKASNEKMSEIKNTNAKTIEGIKSLSEQIKSIWEIVNIINAIADQTKIIAFNAELEASAAGDAGKNFEIVASEIRRLADNTVTSTREIKDKINEIQKSSDDLIFASESGTIRIDEGLDLSRQTSNIFTDILEFSEKSANSSHEIAMSINQQVSAFEQILITLKQISKGIEYFVSSTKSTTNSTDNLRTMSDNLKHIVDRYKVDDEPEMVAEMINEIS